MNEPVHRPPSEMSESSCALIYGLRSAGTVWPEYRSGLRSSWLCGFRSQRRILFFLGLGPVGDLPQRTRYASAMVMALVTMVCSFYGHSSTPGTTIYLKEIESRTVAHIRRACPTISTSTFLASAALLTSRKNAMRAPRAPSWVFKRT